MAEAQRQQQDNQIERVMVDAVENNFNHSDAIVGQAKRYVESLKFDHFDENITHKAMKGIKPEHFERVVNNIASRHHIPDETRDEIVTSQYADGTEEYLYRFCCQPDGMNNFRYGVIVTRMNSNGKMDLAYSVYSLAFGFPPDLEWKTNKKELKLFGFTLASWSGKQYVPKTKVLSQSNQNLLKVYFETKAIEPFKRQDLKALR